MKSIECPHCQKNAVRLWYLFVFPSPLWINWACMKCKKGIRFNWFFIKFWLGSIIAGILIGIIVDKLGVQYPDPIGSLIMAFLYFLPAVLGIPLFLKEKEKKRT